MNSSVSRIASPGNGSRGKLRVLARVLFALALLLALDQREVRATVSEKARAESQGFFEEALEKISTGDYLPAEVFLRNALQQDPANLPARISLGTLVLDLDQPKLAIEELEHALKLGGDENLILPSLARGYLAIVQPESVLTKIVPNSKHRGEVAGEIHLARARAYLMMGAETKAQAEYVEAGVQLPTDHRPPLGLARIAMIEGEYDQAIRLLEKAVLLSPDAADVWAFRAKVMRDTRQYKDAASSYAKAIELDPAAPGVYAGRAAMWVDMGRYKEARKDLETVKSLGVDNLQTIYLDTLMLFGEGKVDEARSRLRSTAAEILEIPDKLKDKLPNTRLMLGIISYFNGNYDTAVKELTLYLDRIPHHLGAKRYLASAYLGLGDWDNVIKTFQAGFRDPVPRDPIAISLIAEAYRQKGRFKQAEKLFLKALEISPRSAGLALKLAQSRIDAGEIGNAERTVEQLVKRLPNFTEAQVQLARIYVRTGALDKAMQTAAGLTRRHPQDPQSYIVLAAAYMALGRLSLAESALKQAMQLDPKLIQPRLNLGRLSVRKGDPKGAEEMFRGVLADHPGELSTGKELVKLLLARGATEEAREMIVAMLTTSPDSLPLRILKLRADLRMADDQDAAKALIYDFAADFQRTPEALAVAARAYVAVDDRKSASVYFRRSAEFAGYNEKLLLGVARGQIGIRDYDAALWTIEKASAANPENVVAIATKINLLRLLNQLDRAEQTLNEAPPEMRQDYQMLMSEARVRRSRGKLEDALATFERARTVKETAEAVRAIFQMLRRLERPKEAFAELSAWIDAHSADVASRHLLASTYLMDGNYSDAKHAYEAMFDDNLRDVVVLNNLAAVYQRLGDDRALGKARAAYEKAPENPSVIDTYGWILTENGQAAKALPLLREAYARSATNPTIRYHIALALSQLGKEKQAIQELQETLASGENFREIDQAEALLARLRQ